MNTKCLSIFLLSQANALQMFASQESCRKDFLDPNIPSDRPSYLAEGSIWWSTIPQRKSLDHQPIIRFLQPFFHTCVLTPWAFLVLSFWNPYLKKNGYAARPKSRLVFVVVRIHQISPIPARKEIGHVVPAAGQVDPTWLQWTITIHEYIRLYKYYIVLYINTIRINNK